MTDIELVKRCAERMGIEVHLIAEPEFHYADCPYYEIPELSEAPNEKYDPLHDDAQAMQLVKKFGIQLTQNKRDLYWKAVVHVGIGCFVEGGHSYLNRAIVTCIANLPTQPTQEEK